MGLKKWNKQVLNKHSRKQGLQFMLFPAGKNGEGMGHMITGPLKYLSM
jgi:hypothetical protein